MIIKNIKTEYCNDPFQVAEIFHANLNESLCNEIIERERALHKLNLQFEEKNCLYFVPQDAFCPLGVIICVNIADNGFMLEIEDEDDYLYESEWLPIEALTKERFLLCFNDDREVVEYEDTDDIEDFTAIYAESLEEAKNQLIEMTADVREAFGEHEEVKSIRELKS